MDILKTKKLKKKCILKKKDEDELDLESIIKELEADLMKILTKKKRLDHQEELDFEEKEEVEDIA